MDSAGQEEKGQLREPKSRCENDFRSYVTFLASQSICYIGGCDLDENGKLIDINDLLPFVFDTARRYRTLASGLSPYLVGYKMSEVEAEASLCLTYLQQVPIEASMQVIDAGHQKVLVFNMFYDANSINELG